MAKFLLNLNTYNTIMHKDSENMNPQKLSQVKEKEGTKNGILNEVLYVERNDKS